MATVGDDIGSAVEPSATAAPAVGASGPPPAPVAAAPSAAASSAAAAVTEVGTDAGIIRTTNPPDAAAPEPLLTGIARLKAEQAQLRAERKRVSKELKNAEKRRTRLRKRARQLSDADLVAVLQMRDTDSSARSSEGSAAAASSAASSPVIGPANAGGV